jgi:mono/diheme cytochrome c family protein
MNQHPYRFASMRAFAIAVIVAGGDAIVTAQQRESANRTVWNGVYTEQQAARGEVAFSANCARCHGQQLEGNNGKPLVGEVFWRDFQARTVEYLLTYMSRNMPNGNGGSLPPATYTDLTAFILNRNQFPSGTTELTPQSAVGVQIVQKGGPAELPAGAVARVVGCLAQTGPRSWVVNNATAPERTDGKPAPEDVTRPLGDRSIQLLFVITSLDKMVGHRVGVRGMLVGQGGVDGINVTTVDSLTQTCE